MVLLFKNLEDALASNVRGVVHVGWPNLHMVYFINDHGARFIYHREV